MTFDNLPILLLGGWLISSMIMLLLWVYYLFSKEPSVVDIGWSASIGCATWWMFFTVPSLGLRQWVLFGFVTFWSLRLAFLLIERIKKGQKDQRYNDLSMHWKSGLMWKYFIFFQAQAFSVALLVTPIALSFLAPNISWSLWDTIGTILFLIGMSGELIADKQMARFRSDSKNQKRVCNVGLWHYSRHPNYFFESVIWISYAVIAMNHPQGFIGWISPITIIFCLLKITGIPPTEKRLLSSKGDAYRQYQQTTSMFIPMPPKMNK